MKKSVFVAALFCFLPFAVSFLSAADEAATAEQLTQRQDLLFEQMAQLDPAAPDYQTQLRLIGAELRRIDNKLQGLGREGLPSGEYQSPEQFAPGVDGAAAAGGTRAFPADPAHMPSADGPAPFSPFDGMDAAAMRQMRTELLGQLKHLNRTLETLGSQDDALGVSLREQQRELTSRIEELDKRIGSPDPEADSPANPAAVPESLSPNPFAFPQADGLADPAQPAAVDTQTVNPLAVPASPTDVDGAWYSSDNKNQQILDAVAALQKSNEEMTRRLDEVMDELKTIETQLKLLSRQAVTDK